LMQYQDGESRTINGVTYTRQGGQWHAQGAPQGPVYGAPTPPKTPPPQTPVNAARDEVGLELDRNRLAVAPVDARKAEIDARKAQLELDALERKAADPTGALGVEQAKATGFYSRAVKANSAYEAMNVGAQNIQDTIAKTLTPHDYEGYTVSTERQKADAVIRGFIAAALRYESGAAIPPEEFESAYKQYFPQPGEGPQTAAVKAQLRANTMEGLKLGSGPGAEQVPPPNVPDDRIGDEIKARVARGDPPAATIQWLISIGRPPNDRQIEQIIANAGNRNPTVSPPDNGGARALGIGVGDIAEGIGDTSGRRSGTQPGCPLRKATKKSSQAPSSRAALAASASLGWLVLALKLPPGQSPADWSALAHLL
jgi:hypothetical protein